MAGRTITLVGRRRTVSITAAAAVLALAATACGGDSESQSEPGASKPDDGTELTMWVRSATDEFSKRLVDAYNKTHENTVKLTIIPNDSYLQKVGAAAGADSLPDLLAADVVYSPNYVSEGLYQDITEQVQGLDSYGTLAKAHVQAATLDGKVYGVPHKVDSSLIFYNKDLYKQAGLDPEDPPKTFQDIYDDAKAIRGLGGETYGFDFAGNCPGCNAYTVFPYAVAAGVLPLTDDGTTANIDNEAFAEAFALYKKLFDEDIVPSGAKTEDGSTWPASFLAGRIGIFPAGSFLFGDLAEVPFDWGLTGLMSPDGSATSTFVGGDVLGVSRSSDHLTQALDFVEWTLDDEAQVEVIAKNGDLPARTDLAGNPYTAKDPRLQATVEGLADGYTPAILPYGELFNDGNGPWLAAFRGSVFGDDADSALADAQSAIQAKLDEAAG